MDVAGWRVFYASGEEYDSSSDGWEDTPRDGLVLVRIYYDEVTDSGVRYTTSLSGDDWYFHIPGTNFFGSNRDSLSENWMRYPDCVFRRGKWVTKNMFDEVKEEAKSKPCPL